MKTPQSFLMPGGSRAALAIAAALGLSGTAGFAADYTWNSNTAGNWNNTTATGWNTGGAYPNAIDDVANLSRNITAATTVTINITDATVGTLNLADTGSTFFGWTVATSDAVNNLLTFQRSSGNALLTSAGTTNTLTAPIVLNSNLDISASSALILRGAITGTGAIIKSGTSNVTLATSSITSGKTISITEGSLSFTGSTSGDYSNLDIRLGATSGTNNTTLTFQPAVASNMGSSNTITVVAGNTGVATISEVAGGGSGALNANIVLGSSGTGKGVTLVNPGNGSNTTGRFGGVISDVAGLTGPAGVVTIAATGPQAMFFGNVNNTYTGGTVVQSGVIQINSGSGAFFGTGPLTVNGGSFRNTAVGATTVTITGYSSMILNADLNFVGTDSRGNNFTGPVNLGATGTDASRIINTTATGGQLTISGVIANGSNGFTTGITKTGTTSLTLSGSNTYTGLTRISSGTLILGANGSFDSSSGVNLGTIGSQGTLVVSAKPSFAFGASQTVTGHGLINIGAGKTVTVSGTLAPGNSPGQINVTGNLALENTTDTVMELASLGGVAGTDFDNVNVTGSLLYDGDLSIVSFGGFNIYQVGTYSLFDFSSQSGNFDTVTFGGDSLTFSSGIWSGNNGSYSYELVLATGDLTVAAIPEPSAAMLLVGGFGVVAFLRRARRNS